MNISEVNMSYIADKYLPPKKGKIKFDTNNLDLLNEIKKEEYASLLIGKIVKTLFGKLKESEYAEYFKMENNND